MGKPLSDRQRSKIHQLIVDHHLAFTVDVLGPDAISRADYQRLVRQGLLKDKPLEHAQVAIQAAHTVGKLATNDPNLTKMKPDQFWRFVETAPPQFSQQERDAMTASRSVVGRLITNLGVGLLNEFEQTTHEEGAKLRHEALATVQHEVALGIARRSSRSEIEKRLKKKLDETERNWSLVVTTELHNAQEHGKALGLARGGRDPLVFKRPRPDACRFCKALFLVKGGRPRVFRLSELVNNGTNFSRRARRPVMRGAGATQWKPVVGCVHPGCQCEMYELPDGMTLDSDGKMIVSMKKSIADELSADLRILINHTCEP
jgi:hypothetical protein